MKTTFETSELDNTSVDAIGPIAGERVIKGQAFRAKSFSHRQFSGLMDPLIMVDHFGMTEPHLARMPTPVFLRYRLYLKTVLEPSIIRILSATTSICCPVIFTG